MAPTVRCQLPDLSAVPLAELPEDRGGRAAARGTLAVVAGAAAGVMVASAATPIVLRAGGTGNGQPLGWPLAPR